jgi:diguanylate cyclase
MSYVGKECLNDVDDYILQLHLNRLRKSGIANPTIQAVWLIDQILEVIAENLTDEDKAGTSFRSQLEKLRREVLESDGGNVQGITALNALDLCRGQFMYVQNKRLERDKNFTEIIAYLTQSLASLTGDSRTFHDDLLGTTDRIKNLVELKNIQELKDRITAEVNALNQAVLERKKREQVQYAQLSDKIAGLQKKLEEARAEASVDGLTGVANRRSFDFTIRRWVAAHEKSEEPFTVAIFDLDDFKKINDNYGHQFGDQVLISTAAEIGKSIRASDFLARYGGEEFVVLSSGMKLAESQKRFSALLKSIERMKLGYQGADGKTVSVSITASCGVAEYALGENLKDLVGRADSALYEAKRAGKNQVATKRRPLLSAFYEGRKRS